MAKVTLSDAGVGATQVGTVTTTASNKNVCIVNDSDAAISCKLGIGSGTKVTHKIDAKSYKVVTGLAAGTATITDVRTTHGTAAQDDELVYLFLAV